MPLFSLELSILVVKAIQTIQAERPVRKQYPRPRNIKVLWTWINNSAQVLYCALIVQKRLNYVILYANVLPGPIFKY